MSIYALIQDGYVWEVIGPYIDANGVSVPIEERYTPDMVANMVDITNVEPLPDQHWTWDGVTFTPPYWGPTLLEAAAEKRMEMRILCDAEITRTSFSSAALGSVHNYDCRIVDQMNLQLRYIAASSTGNAEPLWASDGTRYEWKDHLASEIAEVIVDCSNHIKDNQTLLVTKLAAVDAATTLEQVNAITW